jgi:hypothetical protein
MLDIRYVKDKVILKCKLEIRSPMIWQLKHDSCFDYCQAIGVPSGLYFFS